jgi:hypothetical protein
MFVLPLSIAIIFALLFATFHSVRQACLILLNVPFAFVGGVAALWLRGLNLNLSASIGFIALFGVAVLNGVVLVSYINSLRQQGFSAELAIREGAVDRLRPVLITALVASIGFLPQKGRMKWSPLQINTHHPTRLPLLGGAVRIASGLGLVKADLLPVCFPQPFDPFCVGQVLHGFGRVANVSEPRHQRISLERRGAKEHSGENASIAPMGCLFIERGSPRIGSGILRTTLFSLRTAGRSMRAGGTDT